MEFVKHLQTGKDDKNNWNSCSKTERQNELENRGVHSQEQDRTGGSCPAVKQVKVSKRYSKEPPAIINYSQSTIASDMIDSLHEQ